MPETSEIRRLSRTLRRSTVSARFAILRLDPARLLLLGYVSYMLIGWALLSLPPARATPVAAIDNLFIATSAVSTTGLVTVDPGASYTRFGQIVILVLIQVGGLGYMTISSFAILAVQHRLGRMRERTIRAGFSLPEDVSPASFVASVVIFTLVCEAAGGVALHWIFLERGVEDPAWSAVFHAISAFCTAGFSLNADSFESYRGHIGLNAVIATLSILGAMGFLIVVDAWRTLTRRKRYLGFTSRVILRITVAFLIVGTAVLFVVEPTVAALPAEERLLAAFFQAMTASTTVGFNTMPMGEMSAAVLIVFFVLMAIGASPAGTGGGLKTTSFAALTGLVRSTLKGRDEVRFFRRKVPWPKVQTATASLSYYLGVLTVALFFLFLTERGADFEVVVFEAMSAMGTVGLSMGLTGDLSDLGKAIVVVLMTAGRVGILTFGIAIASHEDSGEEDDEGDDALVL